LPDYLEKKKEKNARGGVMQAEYVLRKLQLRGLTMRPVPLGLLAAEASGLFRDQISRG
jgi:hypothetical protein